MPGQLEFKDIVNTISSLKTSFLELSRLFNAVEKRSKITEMESKAGASDFWTDTQRAQAQLKILSDLKKDIERWDRINTGLEDAKAHYELARETDETSEIPEIAASLDKISLLLNDWDF